MSTLSRGQERPILISRCPALWILSHLLSLTMTRALIAAPLPPQSATTSPSASPTPPIERAPEEQRLSSKQAGHLRHFEQGKNAYLYGDYLLAIESLTPLLEPELKLSEPETVIEAYSYLGLAHFYLNHQDLARQSFTALIFFQPDHQLDPVQVPPEAVSFFNQIRESLSEELVARQALLQGGRRQEENISLRETVFERQVNSPLVALLPFGIGQFQNGDQLAGQLFLVTELLTIGLSSGFFWYIESRRGRDGRFSREEFGALKQLQQAQVITGGLSLGLMLVGATHALLTFQPQLLLKRTTRNQALDTSAVSLHLSGDQLGLCWSF